MNEFQKTYNEQREKDKLNLQVQIVDKALILTLTNGKTNVVAVKNTKGNAELAYQQAFEEVVKNFYQLPEIVKPVSDVVAEMMPTEEELTKIMEKETASVENLLTPPVLTPVTEAPVAPIEESPVASIPVTETPIAQAVETPVIPAPVTEVPVIPVTEPAISQESINVAKMVAEPIMEQAPEYPVMNSEMGPEMYAAAYEMPMEFDIPDLPTDIPMDLPVETYETPVMPQEPVVPVTVPVAEPVSVPTMPENPVQEAFNASNPSYLDESQIGIGNPAKTLIQFGMATGKTVEECSDTELLWYVNAVQPSSKFSNLLQDIKSYLTSKGVM